jgi:hypothetical protein
MHTHSPENYMKTGYPLGMVLCNKFWITFLSYPEFWGRYDGNRRNKLIRESIFIRSIWNNIFFCKKYFVGPRWKALKTIARHTKKNVRLRDKNHAPFKLNGQSRTAKSARIAKTIGHCRSIKSRSNDCRSNDCRNNDIIPIYVSMCCIS